MKRIFTYYWMGSPLDGLRYAHGQEFEYSTKRMNAIVGKILSKGYHVMLIPGKDDADNGTLIIWIDTGRFRQR